MSQAIRRFRASGTFEIVAETPYNEDFNEEDVALLIHDAAVQMIEPVPDLKIVCNYIRFIPIAGAEEIE